MFDCCLREFFLTLLMKLLMGVFFVLCGILTSGE